MTVQRSLAFLSIAGLLLTSIPAKAESFKELVGATPVADVTATGPVLVPVITWGGDYATLFANGGAQTKAGSLYNKLGMNIKLEKGDDFVQQVRNYLSGKSPFLRGTTAMIGMASELIGSDARTKGVMIFQLTWSTGGDNVVTRGTKVKTIKDLKGATVCLQKGGPHEGFLDELLRDVGLTWKDVTVVWVPDLTGPKGPAEAFRKRDDIDICFVITPDMIGLTGGARNTGTGAEGTVKGARLLVSTGERTKSIADVYVCRKDWYDANREWVSKFAAGYLKGVEDLIALKKQYEAGGSKPYTELLQMAQDFYGKDALPTLDSDVHGLLCDCTFAGHPGNVAFFTDPNNLHGYTAFEKSALDLALARGYASVRSGFIPSPITWSAAVFADYLTKTTAKKEDRFRAEAVVSEIEALNSGQLDERTIYEFSVEFEPNQTEFNPLQYGAQFQRVMELADKYGNAVIAVRGHSDPTKVLADFVKAGMKREVLKRTGATGSYQYFMKGKALNLDATAEIVSLIESGDFDGVEGANPRETMQVALNLSRLRAEAVKQAILKFAEGKNVKVDKSQIQPVGVGIKEPVIAKPKNMADAAKNMRVEFRLLRIVGEAVNKSDFDF
jgi:ABC-type nitrate/sulfonate/bicarbonate transport system substrate-binding protein/outer membrane protein OmpA-like peptidoglycan-associated protein